MIRSQTKTLVVVLLGSRFLSHTQTLSLCIYLYIHTAAETKGTQWILFPAAIMTSARLAGQGGSWQDRASVGRKGRRLALDKASVGAG